MLLGNQPTIGAFYDIDDISAEFDGVKASFPTTVNGLTRLLGKPSNCTIVINGVIQAPNTAFTVSGSTLNFMTPPSSGDSFWGVILGNVHVFSNIYEKYEIDGAMMGKSDTSHNHDTRYYTESESDILLDGKSNVGHVHDDRYYTETELNSFLDGKSNVGHVHDDRYFTENEITSFLNDKLDKTATAVHSLDTDTLNGSGDSINADVSSIVKRDTDADISVRLIKSEFGTDTSVDDTADIMMRNNDSTDTFNRYISKNAWREWAETGNINLGGTINKCQAACQLYVSDSSNHSLIQYFGFSETYNRISVGEFRLYFNPIRTLLNGSILCVSPWQITRAVEYSFVDANTLSIKMYDQSGNPIDSGIAWIGLFSNIIP